MSLRSRTTFITAWPLFVNSLRWHLSPKTLRQFCPLEVKSLVIKSPVGQKDKEWDGRTWVEKPHIVLFSLASLDLCTDRRVWSSNPARTPGEESEYERRSLGRLGVSLCGPCQPFTVFRNSVEKWVPTPVSSSHSERQIGAATSGPLRRYVSKVRVPLLRNGRVNEMEPQCLGPQWGHWPGPRKHGCMRPLSSCLLCYHRLLSRSHWLVTVPWVPSTAPSPQHGLDKWWIKQYQRSPDLNKWCEKLRSFNGNRLLHLFSM